MMDFIRDRLSQLDIYEQWLMITCILLCACWLGAVLQARK